MTVLDLMDSAPTCPTTYEIDDLDLLARTAVSATKQKDQHRQELGHRCRKRKVQKKCCAWDCQAYRDAVETSLLTDGGVCLTSCKSQRSASTSLAAEVLAIDRNAGDSFVPKRLKKVEEIVNRDSWWRTKQKAGDRLPLHERTYRAATPCPPWPSTGAAG